MALPRRLQVTLASCALILFCAAAGAQETKKEVATRNFEIISVDGNKVVYRTASGVKEITLADDFKLDMDGQKIGVHDLKPGMKGTAYLTTTTTTQPVFVTEVRDAEVLAVSGNTIIVRGQNGVRKFTIDDVRDKNITIMKDGQPVELHGLRKGDKLTATIITRGAPTVMTESELRASVAALPPAEAPAAVPTMAPAAAAPATAAPAAAAPAPRRSDDGAPCSCDGGALCGSCAPHGRSGRGASQDGFSGLGLDRSPGARDSHRDLLEPQPAALTLVPEVARSLVAPGHSPGAVASGVMFVARPGVMSPGMAPVASRLPAQVRRGFLAGFTLHRELEDYVTAGVLAPRVLQLATLGAARVMKHDRETGSIAPQKVADLILVDGEPTARISDIRRVVLKEADQHRQE